MFRRYLVVTDLQTSPKSTRRKISDELSRLGESYEIKDSVWIVHSDSTKDTIGKQVWSLMQQKGSLVVTNIGGVYHTGRDKELDDYLTTHVNER